MPRLKLPLSVVALALACACVRPVALERPATPAEAQALLAALAARERATRGLRVSMSVRVSGAGAPAALSSPAYVAVDAAGGIRLQVLSPFGMTVLDLAITGRDYVLTLPMRNETKRGVIDLAALAAGTDDPSDRMVVALALLFTPKIGADCKVDTTRALRCPLGGGVTAHLDVDPERRPIRERYTGADGRELFTAEYANYAALDALVPGRLEVSDPASGGRMVAKVTRVRLGLPASRE